MWKAIKGGDLVGDMEEQGGPCKICGCPFDPHVFVATNESPKDGGITLCPVPECKCFSTWGMGGRPVVFIPDIEHVTLLRKAIQSQRPLDGSDPWEGDPVG